MEDVSGTGRVRRQPDPAEWDVGEIARAAALMATFGGDRVVPYGIDATGSYDVATGEWSHPALGTAGTITRRRQVAVNFGVRMFLEDVSPFGVAAGRKLARDTAVVNGSRGDFAALRNGYSVAQRLATVAERQHAVGGVRVSMEWATSSGEAPTEPGTYPLEVHVSDVSGKPVGFGPVLQLSATGLDGNRSRHAKARVDDRRDSADDRARTDAARATGWPDWAMEYRHADDERFAVSERGDAADVADASGVARFQVEITDQEWELAFRAQAPTADVELHAGTGLQGQVTWVGGPQSGSIHQVHRPTPPSEEPDRHVVVVKTATDPDVPVTGTEFALYDGSGDEIGRSVVGGDGRAVFPGFSPTRFEPPYVLRERRAAPGLSPLDGEIAVPPPVELSTDPDHPTVVEVVNEVIVPTIAPPPPSTAPGTTSPPVSTTASPSTAPSNTSPPVPTTASPSQAPGTTSPPVPTTASPSQAPNTTSPPVPTTTPSVLVPPTTGAARSRPPPAPATAPATAPAQTIPRTGTDLTGRAVDLASLLLFAGLILLAVIPRRPAERRPGEEYPSVP